jgi:hypothetical protein
VNQAARDHGDSENDRRDGQHGGQHDAEVNRQVVVNMGRPKQLGIGPGPEGPQEQAKWCTGHSGHQSDKGTGETAGQVVAFVHWHTEQDAVEVMIDVPEHGIGDVRWHGEDSKDTQFDQGLGDDVGRVGQNRTARRKGLKLTAVGGQQKGDTKQRTKGEQRLQGVKLVAELGRGNGKHHRLSRNRDIVAIGLGVDRGKVNIFETHRTGFETRSGVDRGIYPNQQLAGRKMI